MTRHGRPPTLGDRLPPAQRDKLLEMAGGAELSSRGAANPNPNPPGGPGVYAPVGNKPRYPGAKAPAKGRPHPHPGKKPRRWKPKHHQNPKGSNGNRGQSVPGGASTSRGPSTGSAGGRKPPAAGAAVVRQRHGDDEVREERAKLLRHLRALDDVSREQQTAKAADWSIGEREARELDRRLQAGVQSRFPGGRETGPPVRVVMGFDFGTSCSKVVIRGPDLPQRRAVAVPALPFARADDHPFLWRSWAWLAPDGDVSLAPAANGKLICGIKAGLMGERRMSKALAALPPHVATPAWAGVAYLALMIRQARGWFLTHHGEFNRGPLQWSLNVGFPAATLDDRQVADDYLRLARAAWRLSGSGQAVTIDACKSEYLASAGDGASCASAAACDAEVVPEIAAAVAGFAQSVRREDGLYALIDVGATTLDLSTFNLHADRGGLDRLSVLLADMQRFGMEPWRACENDQEWGDPFRRQTLISVRQIIWDTRRRRDPNSPRWQAGSRLPVFATGGGASSPLHGDIITSLDPWLRQHTGGLTGIELRRLDTMEGLDLGETQCDLGRLIVASGLSLPREEIPDVTLPGGIPDADMPVLQDLESAFVSKDQV